MIDLDGLYSSFEQSAALAWATASFGEWLRLNPNAELAEREKAFASFVEGGLYVATGTLRDHFAK